MLKFFVFTSLFAAVIVAAENDNCNCQNVGKPEPVCGTDGQTYHNREVLSCHKNCGNPKLRIASKHACTCICENTMERLPVCASDGNTYYNPQAVKCHNKCTNQNLRVLQSLPCRKGDEERKL